jgi:hypothetical protein
MNLYEFIQNAIKTDDEPIDECSFEMERIYLEADNEEKKQIDRMFIALCGWSIKTMLTEIPEIERC